MGPFTTTTTTTPTIFTMALGPSDTHAKTKTTWHIGSWGNPYEGGGRPGKGVVTYALSPNRQRPMANFLSKGFWNVMRRSKNQVLYFIPPLAMRTELCNGQLRGTSSSTPRLAVLY